MASLAQRMKEAMDLRNISQAEIVKRTGIGKSSISTYLSGEYEPKQRNIYKICEVLNVSEAWLMGYDAPMEREKLTTIPNSELESECISLFQLLTKEQQSIIISQIKGILSNQ
ncbi:MAG: helix-turn-helix transcriptional regulator [Clostridia bacterium]|nr:helix-turn-helix transcriptional regulator [Clostridia bacterium]